MSIAPEDLGTILGVWAHPDDEAYTMGGVMARAVANGQRVVGVPGAAIRTEPTSPRPLTFA